MVTGTNERLKGLVLLGLLSLFVATSLLFTPAEAVPAGATITFNSTDYGPVPTVGSITTNRSTITTMNLNATQQDQFWKAYVGNVTGVLTLDDVDGNTIYDWSLTGVTITGEVYVSRSNGLTFAGMECANGTTISTEQTFNNMSAVQTDNINSTFNWTLHDSFYVGSIPIANSTCQSTFTYINDSSRSGLVETSLFQEMLLQDASDNLIYVTLIEDNEVGYLNTTTYDFQLLVADSNVKATPTTYYFYLEIASS